MGNYILQWGYFKSFARTLACLSAAISIVLAGCSGEDSFTFDSSSLHGPLSITTIPGTSLALVVSTNFDFSNSASNPDEDGGAIHPIDLATMELLTDEAVQIPNFGGQLSIDPVSEKLFLADRNNDALRVFDYSVPGSNGRPIDIVLDSVVDLNLSEDPFPILLINPAGASFRKLYVANVFTGDLNLINADSLALIDLDPDNTDREALPLDEFALGSINFENQIIRPNRLIPFGTDDLFLISTSFSGLLYIIDAKDDQLEAIINLQTIAGVPDLNGVAITPSKMAYIASHGIEGIIVLDLSGVTDNGINAEELLPPLVQTIATGSEIEDLEVSMDGSKIYAANFSRNSLLVLDATTGFILTETTVGQGPTELALSPDGSELLITNFLSNSVSVIDTATDTVKATIR